MSDTVLVSLITFASGAIGSVCGIVGMYLATKSQCNAQARQLIFEKRSLAFFDLFSTMKEWGCDTHSDSAITSLFDAATKAGLLASKETASHLDTLMDYVETYGCENYDYKKFESVKNSVFLSMKKDLLNTLDPAKDKLL